tara:strand:- start:109 stop:255 length:147 start_codon:yes stop_codon:yes gene_type:complete
MTGFQKESVFPYYLEKSPLNDVLFRYSVNPLCLKQIDYRFPIYLEKMC